MRTLEEFIMVEVLGTKALSKYKDVEIRVEEEGNINLLLTNIDDGKSTRVNITKRLWGPIQSIYDTYVSTEMLRSGYHLIAMEGGHIVYGGDEPYQIINDRCTCPHYIYKKTRCQHLIFRDWHLNYRVRCNEIRMIL